MERVSPDLGDISDTEALSAPSEFLSEFLSAIMRRQYAEALKYCRLILQYEPHNATARGFYPLLRHRARRSASASASASPSPQASSASASASVSPPSSPSAGRTPHSLDSSSASGSASGCASASGSASAGWDSSGSARPASAPPPPSADANGNPPPPPPRANGTPRRALLTADDVENDNASASGEPHCSLRSEASTASLRRLRAQFACSIK